MVNLHLKEMKVIKMSNHAAEAMMGNAQICPRAILDVECVLFSLGKLFLN